MLDPTHPRSARGLVADDNAADDVVQEIWRQALERPPAAGHGLGAWLRTVTRRQALKHRRGEARRLRRELDSARPERLASTVEVLADREILRRVVDAVLALSEPYQSALVLRFYEDLPPRAIAPGARIVWHPVLERGLELEGRITFADDVEPFLAEADWLVEYRANDPEPWIDETTVVDSAFALPNVPAGRGRLLLYRIGGDFPAHVIADVDPALGPLALDELHALVFRDVEPPTTLSVTRVEGDELWCGRVTGTMRLAVPQGSYRVRSVDDAPFGTVEVTTREGRAAVVAAARDLESRAGE